MRQRESAIDLLKFFAALLITNSHLAVFEPAYRFATGGAIGDIMFLFCSGYTLFLGQMGRFDNWYKKRLTRIFPPVICWAILAAFVFDWNDSVRYMMIEGGGWFVQCILLYYIFAYPIRRYALRYLNIISGGVLILSCIWFIQTAKEDGMMLYGWNYCKWAVFFLFFLQGARIGLRQSSVESLSKFDYSFAKSICGLVISVILWYGILFSVQHYSLANGLQLLSIIPLLGVSSYFFKLCKSSAMQRLFHNTYLHPIFMSIGGLCYEIYLVQYTLFKSVSVTVTYPYNIFVIWILIIFWAYVLHVVTNFALQTLRTDKYDWKAIFKIY